MDMMQVLEQLLGQIEQLPEAKQDELMAMVQSGASQEQIDAFFQANQAN